MCISKYTHTGIPIHCNSSQIKVVYSIPPFFLESTLYEIQILYRISYQAGNRRLSSFCRKSSLLRFLKALYQQELLLLL